MMKLSEDLLYAFVQHLNVDCDRDTLVALSTTS
jgi:phosphoribosyl-AMP cyclohydrolase